MEHFFECADTDRTVAFDNQDFTVANRNGIADFIAGPTFDKVNVLAGGGAGSGIKLHNAIDN